MTIQNSQITDSVLMIKPISFNYNSETAVNNYYQTPSKEISHEIIQEEALKEFNAFIDILYSRKIGVVVVEDTLKPITPDSVFPNNWISFHQNGSVAIYPMFARNRRAERREDILKTLEDHGFYIKKLFDYSKYENMERFLEGTGSMILDRINKKVYCAISPRADYLLLTRFCNDFEYTPVIFKAYQWVDGERLPIYHTNVLMALGEEFAIICSEAIDDVRERETVITSLISDKKAVVDISEDQVESFAGNALQLKNKEGRKFLIISESAKNSLSESQIDIIERSSEIISVDISTIQKYGGGSVRCMMAEIFLPKKN